MHRPGVPGAAAGHADALPDADPAAHDRGDHEPEPQRWVFDHRRTERGQLLGIGTTAPRLVDPAPPTRARPATVTKHTLPAIRQFEWQAAWDRRSAIHNRRVRRGHATTRR